MLFFLMLFAMTRMSAEDRAVVASSIESTAASSSARREASQARQSKKEREAAALANIEQALRDESFAGGAHMAVDDKTVKITLSPGAFFSTGSAVITPRTLEALNDLVAPIREFPNDIIIEGHTDNVPVRGGVYRSNWELSVARAVSVINFFASKGLNPGKMIAGGYGEYHPAHPNDTEENRARNRRIEITILRKAGGGR